MGEEAAFAHAQLLGKRANGETFQALRGGDIDCTGENSFASTEAFLLSAKHGLMNALVDALFN